MLLKLPLNHRKTLYMYETQQKIFTRALNLLSSHHYSEQQLRHHLIREFSNVQNIDTEIEKIIVNLESLNFIDDVRLAARLAEQLQPKGDRMLRQILKDKLIPESLIDTAISQLIPELERAKSEALRYCPCINQHSMGERQKKLLAHLLSLGFTEDICFQIVKSY